MGRLLASTAVLLLAAGLAASCNIDLGEVPFYCCKDCDPQCPDGYECKGQFCVKNGSCFDFVPNCCGNHKCEGGEDPLSCPTDCSGTTNNCGNGKCDPGEDPTSCPADCSSSAACGDSNCEPTESCTSCSKDCGACPTTCGNGSCDGGETPQNCPADCGSTNPVCGNGKCESGETSSNCPKDCSTSSCTQDQTQCDGTDKIRYCDSGAWQTETCEALCKTQYDYSAGCQLDPTTNKEVCLCGDYGQLGDLCDQDLLCDPSMFCGQFDTTKPGFCSMYCTTPNATCPGGPSGTKAACVLQVGTQYACGFLCDYYSCPTGLTCQSLGTDLVCQP